MASLITGGKVATAAFVMAFVKGEEIHRFRTEGHSVRGIARFYDRSTDMVERAIQIINENQAAIQSKDVLAVAAKVWKGRLGWQRFDSFLTAQSYIERGELLPRDGSDGKRRSRKKTVRQTPSSPAPADTRPPALPSAPAAAPSVVGASAVNPGVAEPRTQPQPEFDEVLDALSSKMPIVLQANKAAANQKHHAF